MFHLRIWKVLDEYVADLVGNIDVELLVGRTPIETCSSVSEGDMLRKLVLTSHLLSQRAFR